LEPGKVFAAVTTGPGLSGDEGATPASTMTTLRPVAARLSPRIRWAGRCRLAAPGPPQLDRHDQRDDRPLEDEHRQEGVEPAGPGLGGDGDVQHDTHDHHGGQQPEGRR
jgi:hypothetical protein